MIKGWRLIPEWVMLYERKKQIQAEKEAWAKTEEMRLNFMKNMPFPTAIFRMALSGEGEDGQDSDLQQHYPTGKPRPS